MDAWEGDPATPMSLHRYLYVYDDPALLVDESGNTPLSDFVSQLNGYLARLGGNAGKYTARGIGSLAHYAIEADVLLYYGLSHVVLPEQVLPGIGRVDLIVDLGIYEIKPLGGTVGPGPQLNRYLSGRPGFALGTIPFDDNVNKLILAAYLLPPWVNLHYELTSPGVIQYNFSFDTRILLPVLVYAVVRVGIAAINYQVQMDAATALMPI